MEKMKSFADEERIDAFLAEHRPIVEDPEAGEASLRRVVIAASEEYQRFSKEQIAAAKRASVAANKLSDAINNPGVKAGAVLVLEKRYAKEKAEHERVKALGERLLAFFDEAQARYEEVSQTEKQPEPPVKPEKPGFFRRLFGRTT